MWFFMMISRKSRFYFVRMRRFIYSRIFLVDYMLYCSWRLVIYFLSRFFLVLSLRVWTSLASDWIFYSFR